MIDIAELKDGQHIIIDTQDPATILEWCQAALVDYDAGRDMAARMEQIRELLHGIGIEIEP